MFGLNPVAMPVVVVNAARPASGVATPSPPASPAVPLTDVEPPPA
jgi:hypothetical protein